MPSFDVVSRVDMQEMDNAVNQVKKEIATRFDFRGSKTQIDLDRKEGEIHVLTEDDMKLRAIKDMLIAKVVRRSIEADALVFGPTEKAGGRHGPADGEDHQRHRHRDRAQGGQGSSRTPSSRSRRPSRARRSASPARRETTCRTPYRPSRKPTWGCPCSSSTTGNDELCRTILAATSLLGRRPARRDPGVAGGRRARMPRPRGEGGSPASGGVVIAHPHPLYGGTMAQPVVYRVARACRERGLASLRFNFRGVGTERGAVQRQRGIPGRGGGGRVLAWPVGGLAGRRRSVGGGGRLLPWPVTRSGA